MNLWELIHQGMGKRKKVTGRANGTAYIVYLMVLGMGSITESTGLVIPS